MPKLKVQAVRFYLFSFPFNLLNVAPDSEVRTGLRVKIVTRGRGDCRAGCEVGVSKGRGPRPRARAPEDEGTGSSSTPSARLSKSHRNFGWLIFQVLRFLL